MGWKKTTDEREIPCLDHARDVRVGDYCNKKSESIETGNYLTEAGDGAIVIPKSAEEEGGLWRTPWSNGLSEA